MAGGVIERTITWLVDPTHWSGPNGIPVRLAEHAGISALSLAIAVAIALPVGLWIGHSGRGAAFAIGAANLWRALPSFAVIAIVLPLTVQIDPQAGFKLYPTVVAMVVLGLPPVLVNAYQGIVGVERELVEAGRGQGMTERQLLTRVELPLALPAIGTGIRSAAIQIVATATLGAVFAFGGLGRYLVDGIAQGDAGQAVGGALLVAGLVLATEFVFRLVQRRLEPAPLRAQAAAAGGAIAGSPL